jgi:hypothetical protein
VHTGTQTSFGVTADGGRLVFDERLTEYEVWTLSVDDVLRGDFSDDKRISRSTIPPLPSMSRDGSVLLFVKDAGAGTPDERQWTIVPFGGGEGIPIPGRHLLGWLVDSATAGIADATPSGIRFSLFDFRARRTSAVLSISDSSIANVSRLRGQQAWAWIGSDRRTIKIQRDGDSRVRRLSISGAYNGVFHMIASPDGNTIAFMGRNPTGDSVGVAMVSVPDGRVTPVTWAFGELGRMQLLDDGSLAIAFWDAVESASLYRTRPGGRLELLGKIPRAIGNMNVSADMRRAFATTRDFHGDAWMSSVVR